MKRKVGVSGQIFFNGNTWIKPEDSENLAEIQKTRGANILKDDVKRDLAANSNKINGLMNSLSDEPRNIDGIINNINSCLSDIVNKYTKIEVTKTLK